jgi:tetratricopeptide (TPR) repeat protein
LSGARRSLVALGAAVVLAALAAQLFGDGLYGALAVDGSIPRRLAGDWPFALAARSGLDRIGPVRVALARGALVQNEPARALALLAPFPASAEIVDLRGRAELERGAAPAALHDFAAAGDFIAAGAAIDALGARDPVAELALVRDFAQRLAANAASPEIGAEVDWREGQIAAQAAAAHPDQATAYQRAALAAYRRALDRAPDEEKYLLNDAFTALVLGGAADARATYQRAAQVVPDSVDAFVGIAVTSAVLGDCAAARAALAQARDAAVAQHVAVDPAAAGFAPAARAALARCAT